MDRKEDFKLCLVLNKVDKVVPKRLLLTLSEELNKLCYFSETFMISASDNDGVDDIRECLVFDCSKPAPWMFEDGRITDMTDEDRVNEIIREKVFQRINQEIPYTVSQGISGWREDTDGTIFIENTLYVDNLRYKEIICGKSDATLRQIQYKAKKDIAEILGKPVELSLSVVVKKKWQMNAST